ncbi:MAG: hypothetical protein NTU76_03800 [Candidatus Taylorbacteria bacterium]|nr:hypothetical protein [Candidatus Taylorbacteria bacterium]
MSHYHNGNNLPLIIVLCILFPGLAMALGAGFIFLGILKVLFYVLVVVIYLIYTYFWWIFLVGAIVFVFYALSKKQTPKITDKKSEDVLPIQTVLRVHSRELPILDEYVVEDYSWSDRNNGDEEEIHDLMENNDLDRDEAEHVKEIMDENGLDEDEAVELKDEL